MTDTSNNPNIIWYPNESQDLFLRCPIFEVLFSGNRGGGKCISLDSKVLTDTGWKLAGNITFDDMLVSVDGSLTEITGIFNNDNSEMYEITFCDGAKIKADSEHRWSTKRTNEKEWVVKNTGWILNKDFDKYHIPKFNPPKEEINFFSSCIDGFSEHYKKSKVIKHRTFKSIVKINNEPAVCFSVAHPSQLFVVQDFIVTHNTDALIMDFAQFVGKGYGAQWRGILFRENHKNLEDVKNKILQWFPRMFPGFVFLESASQYVCKWPTGEQLYLRHAEKLNDYWNFHGHSYPWVGWEELTNWRSLELYTKMMSLCRSTVPGIPRHYRATCNPSGIGHNAVKKRFKITEVDPLEIIEERQYIETIKKELVMRRCNIISEREHNHFLTNNDPNYEMILAKQTNPNTRKAWLEGSWDIVAGGMFDDIWDRKVHVLPVFDIPESWYIDRSFDWGTSKPFCVDWWAMSDGTPIEIKRRFLKDGKIFQKTFEKTLPYGTLVLIFEWYGCKEDEENVGLRMTSTDVGKGIKEREEIIKRIYPSIKRINPGPADSSIFNNDHQSTNIAEEMNIGYGNDRLNNMFVHADKKPGTRKIGWELMRTRLKNSLDFPMEKKGLFVVGEYGKAFLRTVPTLPRSEKDSDDVNTDSEDHCLSGNTLVCTERGKFKIKELVGTEGKVLTDLGYKDYRSCRMTGKNKSVLKLYYTNGTSFVCTPEHKILTNMGWIEAKDIKYESCYCYGDDYKSKKVVFVKNKELLAEKEDVYCLTVPEVGRFCVEGGILIANCGDSVRYRCLHQPVIAKKINYRV